MLLPALLNSLKRRSCSISLFWWFADFKHHTFYISHCDVRLGIENSTASKNLFREIAEHKHFEIWFMCIFRAEKEFLEISIWNSNVTVSIFAYTLNLVIETMHLAMLYVISTPPSPLLINVNSQQVWDSDVAIKKLRKGASSLF